MYYKLKRRPVSSLVTDSVDYLPVTPSDHVPIICKFDHPNPTNISLNSKTVSFRQISKINIQDFCNDIECSHLYTTSPDDLNNLVDLYDSTLSTLLNKHAPTITKRSRPSNPWYTSELRKKKAICRRAERKWHHRHSSTWKIRGQFGKQGL